MCQSALTPERAATRNVRQEGCPDPDRARPLKNTQAQAFGPPPVQDRQARTFAPRGGDGYQNISHGIHVFP